MKKTELLAKLEAIEAQGLNASVSVKEMIELVNSLELQQAGTLTDQTMDELAEEIATYIEDKGVDVISDYDLTMSSYREVSLDHVEFDRSLLVSLARKALALLNEPEESYFQ